jgi:hypothetical protein
VRQDFHFFFSVSSPRRCRSLLDLRPALVGGWRWFFLFDLRARPSVRFFFSSLQAKGRRPELVPVEQVCSCRLLTSVLPLVSQGSFLLASIFPVI